MCTVQRHFHLRTFLTKGGTDDKLREDWNGWLSWFLKTCRPNSFSEVIFVVRNV